MNPPGGSRQSKTKEQKKADYENLKKLFSNCIKIKFDSKEKILICRKDILDGLKSIDIFKFESIERISQYKNNYTWIISFNNLAKADNFIGKQITILNKQVTIEHPVDEFDYQTFKIMWLPPRMSPAVVSKYLEANAGETILIKEIIVKDNCYGNIATGIYNITIKYPLIKSLLYETLTGVKFISGQKLFISRYGEPPKCFFCQSTSHMKEHCEKFKLICKDCGKRGHEICTMATKLAASNDNSENILIDDADLSNTNSVTLNTSDKTALNQNNVEIKSTINSSTVSNTSSGEDIVKINNKNIISNNTTTTKATSNIIHKQNGETSTPKNENTVDKTILNAPQTSSKTVKRKERSNSSPELTQDKKSRELSNEINDSYLNDTDSTDENSTILFQLDTSSNEIKNE